MILAPVNKIIPYSVVDGPGNRVAIFVQKCNIHCLYCHNPETQNLCQNCGKCISLCPAKALSFENGNVKWDKDKCVSCDTCIKTCEYHASPRITYMTPDQVYIEVKKSIPFIRGISVSGGECDLYPEFLVQLFRLAKQEKLTCLMDCNGTIDLSLYPDLMDISDGVMLDVKAWDSEVFRKLTGFENSVVKKNLKYLDSINKLEEIRIVCLPGYVDAENAIQGIASVLCPSSVQHVLLKLIKFRHFGVKGILNNHVSPNDEYMNKLEIEANKIGFQNTIII